MKQYLDLVNDIRTYRVQCPNRTGVDTLALFGYQYRCRDVAEHFPLLTTKEVNFRAMVVELLWKLSGSTNIKPLVDQKVHIWNEWPFQNWLKETNQESLYPKYSAEWKTKQKEFVHFIAKKKTPKTRSLYINRTNIYFTDITHRLPLYLKK